MLPKQSKPVGVQVIAASQRSYHRRRWLPGSTSVSKSHGQSRNLRPAPLTNDSEFVRRSFLDLIGRIPSVAETRAFLDDTRPDKRTLLIEELLQRGAFAAHLANTWRDLLLAGNTAIDARTQAPALETWLKLRFSANMPYDQLAGELLTATLEQNNPRAPSPLAFYQSAEFKPEQLAASVSKVFLGVQVQCAQCHDHPFADWKQPQFWSFAALFKNLDQPRGAGMMLAEKADSDDIQIPGKEVLVPALFLDGSKPDRSTKQRQTTDARALDHGSSESVLRQGRRQSRLGQLLWSGIRTTDR